MSVVVIFGLSLLVFLMINLSGDPVRLLLPPDATAADVETLRKGLGLDKPLPERYVRFLGQFVRFDFGASLQYRQDALELVMERLPKTLSLAALSILVAVVVGVPLGMLAALTRDKPSDAVITGVAVTGQSMPVFWVGVMAILLFAVQLRWLPAAGAATWQHYVLPTFTLALFLLGGIVRVTRISMLEVLGANYVRTARAKGLAEKRVIWRHALRNAAVPVVTIIGLQLTYVLGGSVITETVFAWPGLGRLLIQAVYARDYPIVEAGVMVIAVFLIVVNTVVDVLFTILNPRMRFR